MIYLVFGPQIPMLDAQVNKLIKENVSEINDFSVIYYDLEATLLQDIIDDAQTLPFGVENKAIIVKNSYIFSTIGPKKDKLEHNIDALTLYLKNPAPFTTLIFTLSNGSLDERKLLVKEMRKKANVIKQSDVDKKDWPIVIKQMIAKRQLTFESRALDEFINRVSGDLQIAIKELDKLENLHCKINLDIIEQLVARPLEENMFGMVDAILANRPDQALQIYNDLRLQNEDPARLVPSLANQFRFLYKVGYLHEQGLNESKIGSELGVNNPYRITFSLRKIGYKKISDILEIINELADLDYQIKSGQIDRFKGFELFIISPH